MEEKRSWWLQIKRPLSVIGIIAVLVVAIVLIVVVVRLYGTGFAGKTLFDWLNLLGVLAVPAVVGVGAALYTASQSKASEEKNKLQHEKDLKIIQNQQQEELLQSYLDHMSDIMLNGLRDKMIPGNETLRTVARGRTLTTLLSLDKDHKGNLLQFLLVSGLINKEDSIVDLREANLRETNIHGAMLRGANLSNTFLNQADLSITYLSEADLSGADLRDANLRDANLRDANLRDANLKGADLRGAIVTPEQLGQAKSLKGATLPDGFIHP